MLRSHNRKSFPFWAYGILEDPDFSQLDWLVSGSFTISKAGQFDLEKKLKAKHFDLEKLC